MRRKQLCSTTPHRIRENLGHGGQVNWIDRGVSHVADLRTYGRVVISGRMKLGKTREAAELIRRAVTEELVPQDRIYEPAPAFRLLTGNTLLTALRWVLTPQLPALLFLDDLPYRFYGDGLEQLEEALAALQECKAAYVVTTARTDQLTEDHQAWLARQGFHRIELSDLNEQQTGRLVDSAGGTFDLRVDDAARAEFVDERDGTPELILTSMRRLKSEGVKQVDREIARSVIQGSLHQG